LPGFFFVEQRERLEVGEDATPASTSKRGLAREASASGRAAHGRGFSWP